MAGGNIRAGGAFVEIFGKDMLDKSLKAASAKLKAFGSMVTTLGAGMTAAASAVGAPFLMAIKHAADMEETMNKFNVVFGENAAAVKQWGDDYAKAVGRSKKQIADFLSLAKGVLVPLGFDEQAANEVSKQLTTLAVDMASFHNMADADVLRDLRGALTGESETMKKYGIVVNETAMKHELLNQGLNPNRVTEYQKVVARLAIIMRGSTVAQGDAIRTAGSFVNQMKALRSAVEDTAIAIGKALLPAVTPMVTAIGHIARGFAEFFTNNQAAIASLGKVVLAVGVAGVVLTGLGVAISVVGAILGSVPAMVATAGAAFLGFTKVGRGMAENLFAAFGGIADRFRESYGLIAELLTGGRIEAALKVVMANLRAIVAQGMYAITETAVGAFETIEGARQRAIAGLAQRLLKAAGGFRGALNELRAFFDSDFDLDTAQRQIIADVQGANQILVDDLRRGEAARHQRLLQTLAEAKADRDAALASEQAALDEARKQVKEIRAEDERLKLPEMPKLDATLGAAADAQKRATEGTFLASAAERLGGQQNIEKKQLEALEEISEGITSVRRTIEDNPLAFV